jgi:hypothetical protein
MRRRKECDTNKGIRQYLNIISLFYFSETWFAQCFVCMNLKSSLNEDSTSNPEGLTQKYEMLASGNKFDVYCISILDFFSTIQKVLFYEESTSVEYFSEK